MDDNNWKESPYTNSGKTEVSDKKWICGFWNRVLAFFLDSLLLGAVGYGLGLTLSEHFVEMGSYGRLVGFAIALAYFGLMNSKIANGQTFGKRMMGIRVVDSSGSSISVPKSMLRYTIFAVPFLFNGAHFTNDAYLSYLIYPLSIIIFGGLFSIIYLYLFNRRTRQSLHDLAVGSFVVNTDTTVEKALPVWKGHIAMATTVVAMAAILPNYTTDFAQGSPFEKLAATQAQLKALPEISFANVRSGQSFISSSEADTKTITFLTAQAYVDESLLNDTDFAKRLAEIVVSNFRDHEPKDVVQIVLTYGFDIGIWSQWTNHNHSFHPIELEQTSSQSLSGKNR